MATVVLTDEKGTPTGIADVLDAHTGQGKLHKAFSVYVFRNGGAELLVQQRSRHKMLWPHFWANTCCSHPLAGEDIRTAGERRLQEECGFTCPLKEHSSFVYRTEDPAGRGVEHEHVTILIGQVEEGTPTFANAMEIANLKWMLIDELKKDMEQQPEKYAPWFYLGMERIGWHRT